MSRHRKARATRTVLSWGAARVERATWRGPAETGPFLNGGVWCMAVRIPGGTYYRPLTWEETAAMVRPEHVQQQVEGERMREIGR